MLRMEVGFCGVAAVWLARMMLMVLLQLLLVVLLLLLMRLVVLMWLFVGGRFMVGLSRCAAEAKEVERIAECRVRGGAGGGGGGGGGRRLVVWSAHRRRRVLQSRRGRGWGRGRSG